MTAATAVTTVSIDELHEPPKQLRPALGTSLIRCHHAIRPTIHFVVPLAGLGVLFRPASPSRPPSGLSSADFAGSACAALQNKHTLAKAPDMTNAGGSAATAEMARGVDTDTAIACSLLDALLLVLVLVLLLLLCLHSPLPVPSVGTITQSCATAWRGCVAPARDSVLISHAVYDERYF